MTSDEFYIQIRDAYLSSDAARDAYNGGPVHEASIEAAIMRSCAACAYFVSQSAKTIKEDAVAYVERMRPHTLKYYSDRMKGFRWSEEDEDQKYLEFEEWGDRYLAEDGEIEEERLRRIRPFAVCSCTESNGKLRIKVASSDGAGGLKKSDIDGTGLGDAARSYLSLIKDAGTAADLVSYNPDLLRLTVSVSYSPVETTPGRISEAITKGVRQYLKELPFDGTVTIDEMERRMLSQGVKSVRVESAKLHDGNEETDLASLPGGSGVPFAGYAVLDGLELRL